MRPQEQLTLNISLRDDATFDNFYCHDNSQIIKQLRDASQTQTEQFIYLWGASGTGRSHLLQACCHAATEYNHTSLYIPLNAIKELALTPAILDNLSTIKLLCLDDIDAVLGQKPWEEAIFHAFNRLHEQNSCLIVTANESPHNLTASLADLKSRLNWGLPLQLKPLSDSEKIAALCMRAKKRGFDMPPAVANFLLARCKRDMTNLFAILDKLD
ncbi:MAG: DnaA regulatory inactivator Hda, partial [Gammaproteobacteria bacterium]|nr:DnaA regulatory inactivator Hda [Gammaproteobacteria bacterium]